MDDARPPAAGSAGEAGWQLRPLQAGGATPPPGNDPAAAAGSSGQLQSEQQLLQHQHQQQHVNTIPGGARAYAMNDPGAGANASTSASGGQQSEPEQQQMDPIPGARNYGYSDSFMMHTFKVELCTRTDKHPRGSCPYAHPGHVARRRPPHLYQALLCPEVRAKKVCPRLQECLCSHSAFEFWLHPDRYRTSMCEKGVRCSRPVCFFAHTPEELRPLPAGLKPAAAEDSSSKRASSSSSSGSASAGPSRRIPHIQQVPSNSAAPYLQQPVLLQQMGVPGHVPGVLPMVPAAAAAAGCAPMGYVPVGHASVQPDMAPLHAYNPGGRLVPPEQLPGGMMQAQAAAPMPSELLAAQFQHLDVAHSSHSLPAVRYGSMPGGGEPWGSTSTGMAVVLPGQQQQQQPLLMLVPPSTSSTEQRQPPEQRPYQHQQQSIMYHPYLASPMEQQGAWPAASPPYQQRQHQKQQPGYGGSQSFDYTGGQPAFPSSAPSSSTGSSSLGMLAPVSVAGLAGPHPAMLPAAMAPSLQAQQLGPATADASGLSSSHVTAGEAAATHVCAPPADQSAKW